MLTLAKNLYILFLKTADMISIKFFRSFYARQGPHDRNLLGRISNANVLGGVTERTTR